MPRGEHLGEMNELRAENRRLKMEAALTAPTPPPAGTATAVLDEPAPIEAPSLINPEDEKDEMEIEMLRARNEALVEELKQAREALKANLPEGLPYPTAKHRASVDMPPNYVVWLGADPMPGVMLAMSVKGRVGQITNTDVIDLPTVGGIKKRTTLPVQGTSHRGLTTEFINQGYTSLEFRHACPGSHKYAGKLWARIDCPEHAAWLFVTAPNGRGGDREHRPLYAFKFGLEGWRNKYEALKRSRMQRKQAELIEQEDVMENAVPMPEDSNEPWQ